VFVNARRLAERLAARLNEIAEDDLVKAHHGSLAREQRIAVESELKAGTLRGLVATSSLELGIDMGAVDLVVQVESPGSVAAGLQRIGRAGHAVGEPSRGKIFPKYRGDLLEAAVVVERMHQGLVEETRIVRNPLDVLAQQLVAACALEEWRLDDLAALVRRTANFADLSEELFLAVVELLAGGYPSTDFSELRPRLVWDRAANTVRGREGAQRLAVTNAGTIPDRGLYGVFLPGEGGGTGTRVGELDEEMVYESRPGETFVLGASTWRIEEITRDRVIVSPAPGEPGKMPFWHGDRPGRPMELGQAVGAFTRLALESGVLPEAAGLDDLAARNLLGYLRDQQEATGAVPDDRTIVVERFRDEIGDWRVCILTPFGARVHAPWALALQARLAQRAGEEDGSSVGAGGQVLWGDDGIAIRLSEASDRFDPADVLVEPEEVDELVTAALPGTALFAGVFRECAARALLLPRRRPGGRTPLWQQRQRASDLLAVAARHPTFPIVLEATRECLSDHFDLPGLRRVLGDVSSRRIRVVPVETAGPSPFAQSLVFSWVAAYMYEGDAPLAERRAAALTLDRDLLRDLLGAEELRELIDPAALAALERELQRLPVLGEEDTDEAAAGGLRLARSPDQVHDLLRILGDLSAADVAARSASADSGEWLGQLVAERRAIAVRVADEDRFAAAEDAARLRDALGVALPAGLPAAFTDPVARPLEDLVARYARTHGPFGPDEAAGRFGTTRERIAGALAALVAEGRLVTGEFRPGGTAREWVDVEVLRRLRRRSLAALRREVEPVAAGTLGRFLPAWQGIGVRRRGADALLDAIGPLQGAPIPASILEASVLPARVEGYRPADLDLLCAAGEVVWRGAGGIGSADGRVMLALRDAAPLVLGPGDRDGEVPSGPVHDAIRVRLAQRGASFYPDLVDAAGTADEAVVVPALWDLVWAGEVTNDTLAPLRAALGGGVGGARGPRGGGGGGRRPRPRPGRLSRVGPPSAAGRWSLVAPLLEPAPSPTEAAHARALQLLDRHGVLTREAVLAEGTPGGFAGVYTMLRAMEESGAVRRGYFVAGLGGAQFALPGAVERLRSYRSTEDGWRESPQTPALLLAAADPAQPFGAALPWPETPHGRPSRSAGAHVLLCDGEPVAYLERGGKSLLTFPSTAHQPQWVDELVAAVKDGRLRGLELIRIDGGPARQSPLVPQLRQAGFTDSYRGLLLRA
jgi:ATP-dependent Lhr-like helicase